MSKFVSTLLASALGLGALAGPAFAASDTPASSPATDASTAKPASASSSESQDYLTETALLPVRAAAVTSAFAIGTPIALLRCQTKQLGQYSQAMVDDMNRNQMLLTPLMVASIPGQSIRMVGSVGKGLKNSSLNALSAWDEPFTSKSFSLDELDH